MFLCVIILIYYNYTLPKIIVTLGVINFNTIVTLDYTGTVGIKSKLEMLPYS